jgi:hypothetical protein
VTPTKPVIPRRLNVRKAALALATVKRTGGLAGDVASWLRLAVSVRATHHHRQVNDRKQMAVTERRAGK